MNSDIKYTIIIPTLNQSAKLVQCLSHLSLLDFGPDLFEVLVVDNGSTDDTKEKSFLFMDKIKNIKYIFCEAPGLMAARHKGCDGARGEILCYIDDDSLVTKEWLKGVDESFADEDVAITGGPCIPEYEKTPPEWISYFWYKTEYGQVNWFLSLIDFGNNEVIINPVYIFGCNYSIRKRIFIQPSSKRPKN